jgi:phosphoketolase
VGAPIRSSDLRRKIASLNYLLASGVGRQDYIEHKQYIDKYGEGMPETRNWKRGSPK